MAGESERTEQATPRKRQEARRKGQVARSPEVTSASLFLGFVLIMPLVIGIASDRLIEAVQQGIFAAGAMRFSREVLQNGLMVLMPIMAVGVLIAILANLIQVGPSVTLFPLMPDLNRINPLKGFQRLFSARAYFELGKSVIKLLLIGWIVWGAIRSHMSDLMETGRMSVVSGLSVTGGLLYQIGLRVGIAWMLLACLDYLFQRWQHEKSIRMSRQELKEEFKQAEGDPTLRARIRQKMTQASRRRMMQDVRKADVVVTNPVTYAVALRYDRATMSAPRVVAKGKGLIAQKIREEALKWHVPIMPSPPLARSLYAKCEIGQEVPQSLYQAVAEVLAYVYRLRQGRRRE